MLYLPHVDSIIVGMGADPLDPHDALLEIYGNNESVVVSLDVEHDPLSVDDAGRRVELLHTCGTRPPSFPYFVEPIFGNNNECPYRPETRGDERGSQKESFRTQDASLGASVDHTRGKRNVLEDAPQERSRSEHGIEVVFADERAFFVADRHAQGLQPPGS